MVNYVEIALSAIVIVVFAVDRFKTPPSDPKDGVVSYRISRSTTTAASYYTALSLYGAIALAVFAFLLLSPQALDRLVASAPEIGEGIPPWARQSPPLLVALILTVLLPKIPILSSMDEWFRARLQRMAAIPHEVRRLSAELRRAPFRVSAEREQELMDAMVAKGLEAVDIRFEEGSAPQHLWTKLSMLMHELDGWDADAHFTSYVLTYPNEFTALRLRYEALVPKTARCFSLLRELTADPEPTKKGGAIYAYRDDVVHEIEALLKDVYEAVSHAVLLCQFTQRARVSQLIRLGFGLDPEPPRRLTINELLGLFTGLTIVYAFGFVLMQHGGGGGTRIDPKLFVLALMIAAIYCVAVWCAIAPKARWRFARRSAAHGRPWGWYLLSGLLAAGSGALISFLVRVVTYRGDVVTAWELYWQTSPWAIMTFATAYALAFLADDEPGDGFAGLLTPARLRWAEAIALT
ncbi:MAG TPA: hypothetical protein VEL48_13910, partial [Candidatus Acidoferrales bacterium]|nr:hypothetical protein [Candidatus Acidoferrales bacterium]